MTLGIFATGTIVASDSKATDDAAAATAMAGDGGALTLLLSS